MTTWIILVGIVALAIAAPRYGADTRTGDSWTAGAGVGGAGIARPRPSLGGDAMALGRALARLLRGYVRPLRPR